ncbi:MAG: hypothetical protein LBK99_09900 [Opitutaceae bacterium]|jgi:hypothetical protein|nr:hypothetical protein [Opitutaceae bacterium]
MKRDDTLASKAARILKERLGPSLAIPVEPTCEDRPGLNSLTLTTSSNNKGFACDARARRTELAYLQLFQILAWLRKRSHDEGHRVTSVDNMQ